MDAFHTFGACVVKIFQTDGQRHRLVADQPTSSFLSFFPSPISVGCSVADRKTKESLSYYAIANAYTVADHGNRYFFFIDRRHRRRRPSMSFHDHLISVGQSVADEKNYENKKKFKWK